MKRLFTLTCAALLLLTTINAVAAEPSLPELFKKAKDKFAAGDHKGSLADFDQLDTASDRQGFEKDRAKLLPVLTFYRGANLAALGRKNEAKEAFISYLALSPNAAIASPPFPKATVEIFEQARKESQGRSATMAVLYSTFAMPADWTLAADERWADSPVRYLLTAAQKKEYAALTSNKERAAFVDSFWKGLDPTPGTGINELRRELERRVAFADATFATPNMAGRFTDRAVVFTFLGPPTYASVSQLATNDEVMGQLRGSRGSAPGMDTDSTMAKRESWYYRAGRIPKDVPYKEVRFDFISKAGYGTAVMQKDSQPMQTLGIAASSVRSDKKLN